MGYNTGDVGTLTVSGTSSGGVASTLNSGNNLIVGIFGTGTLNLTGGASASASASTFTSIGDQSGGIGTVNVSGTSSGGSGGTASFLSAGNELDIGYFGMGSLNITNGGKVSTNTTGFTYLSAYSGSSSSLIINGGSLTTDTITIGANNNGAGTVNAFKLTNPTAANGGGYALNLGGGNGSSTINTVITDAASGDGASGTIAGGPGGAGGIKKSGTGILTLNAANTFSGGMQIDGGSVVLGNGLALQNSTAIVNVNGGLRFGTLTAATLGGLAGSGNITLTNTAATPAPVALTVGGNNASTTYAGVLGGGGSLTKTGVGTLTLTGVGSSISGQASFNNGTTLITGANASFTSGGNTYVGRNTGDVGVLTVSGISSGGAASTFNTNGDLYVGNFGTGTLNLTGGASASVGANRLISIGDESIGIGTVTVSGTSTGGSGGVGSSLSAGNELDIGYRGTGTLNITSGGKVATTTAGGTSLSAFNGSSSSLIINGGSLTTDRISIGAFNNGVGTVTAFKLTNPTLANGGGYALNLGAGNGSSIIGAAITDAAAGDGGAGTTGGAGGIGKTGSGTLTLTGINTYSGGTNIAGGTVVARGTGLGTGQVIVGTNGKLSVGEALNQSATPQASVSTLTIGSLALAANGSQASPQLTFNLGNNGVSDSLIITGSGNSAFSSSGVFYIGFASATGMDLGAGTYTLMTFTGQSASLPSISFFKAAAGVIWWM